MYLYCQDNCANQSHIVPILELDSHLLRALVSSNYRGLYRPDCLLLRVCHVVFNWDSSYNGVPIPTMSL